MPADEAETDEKSAGAESDLVQLEDAGGGGDDVELTPSAKMVLLGDAAAPAPAPAGETAPDKAVDPPGEGPPREPQKPVGPLEARAAKQAREAEMAERAAKWAAIRAKFNQADQAAVRKEKEEAKEARARRPAGRVVLMAAAALAAVGLVGGGAYLLFFAERDVPVTAAQLYDEFDKDNAGANQRYKGKFLQIKGKLGTFTVKNREQFTFDPPAENHWHIEFYPRAQDAKEMKAGQDIILRGRLNPRKGGDENLLVGNCTLVNSK